MAGFFDGFQSRATILVFTNPITKDITEVPIDASLSINTNMTASVTKFPVENSESISDHIQTQPLTVSVSAIFSESPSQNLLTVAQTLASAAASRAGQFQGLSATFASAASALAVSSAFTNFNKFDTGAGWRRLLTDRDENDPEYPKRAMLGLQEAFDLGLLFDIRTYFSDVIYKNMVMTALSFTQDASNGDSLVFNFTAQKVTTVDKFVKKPTNLKVKDPANNSATPAENKGSKATTEEVPGSIAFESTVGDNGLFAPRSLPQLPGPSATNFSIGSMF
jgi:hypothetical protein